MVMESKEGGGVALYIKDDISFSQVGLHQYNVSNKDVECLWIRVIRGNAKDMLLGTLYRPPGGDIEAFFSYLNKSLEELGNNFNKEIFVMGDFNINVSNPNEVSTKLLSDFELTHGLKQLIKTPTRGQNCIDLMFTNASDIANSGVFPINISDHDLIFITKKEIMY